MADWQNSTFILDILRRRHNHKTRARQRRQFREEEKKQDKKLKDPRLTYKYIGTLNYDTALGGESYRV